MARRDSAGSKDKLKGRALARTASVDSEATLQSERAVQEATHDYGDLSKGRAVIMTISLACAMTCDIFLVQATNIALPSMGDELQIEHTSLQWLTSAYSLALGSLLLLFGRIGDLVGHRPMFVLGMTWVAIWSLAIGFAPVGIAAIIMRAAQGIGSAAAIPAALAILGRSFPPGPKKSLAMGTFSGGAPIGAALGAVSSGVLCSFTPVGWRAVFYLAAALASTVAIVAFFAIPAQHNIPAVPRGEAGARRVDWVGAALVVTGLVLLTFALADSTTAPRGWRTPYIPVTLVLGVAFLGVFWVYESKLEHQGHRPIMAPSLWFRPHFAAVQLVAGTTWTCFSTVNYLATLYFQEFEKLSPIQTTLRFLPLAVVGLCIVFVIAYLAPRVKAQYLMIVGCAGYQFVGLSFTVFGADVIFSTGVMQMSKTASKQDQGMCGGVFSTSTQLGTALGLAIMTIVQSSVTSRESSEMGIAIIRTTNIAPPEALLAGLRASFWACAAFEVLAVAVAIVFLRGMGYVGIKHPQAGAQEVVEKAIGENSAFASRRLPSTEIKRPPTAKIEPA